MLNEALQTLLENNISPTVFDSVIRDLSRKGFESEDDKRWFIAYQFCRNEVADIQPEEVEILSCRQGWGFHFEVNNMEFIIASDKEANKLCEDYILDTLWAFRPKYLAEITGLSVEVFEALQPQCENANKAILSIVEGTCGIDYFIDDAIKQDGRGFFLAVYDDEEKEFEYNGEYYYFYRVS